MAKLTTADVKETGSAIGSAFKGVFAPILNAIKNTFTFNNAPNKEPGRIAKFANWLGNGAVNNVKAAPARANNFVKGIFNTPFVKQVAVIAIAYFALRWAYNQAKSFLGFKTDQKQNEGMEEQLAAVKAENAHLAYQFNNERAQGGHRDMVQNARGQQTAMGRGAH